MERKFEEAWRKAMEGAEVGPSGETWRAMESALIAAENQRMKRKVVFYQRVAAASVLFAFLLGAFGFYSWRNNSPGKEDTAALSHLTPHLRRDGFGGQAGPPPKRSGGGLSAEVGVHRANALNAIVDNTSRTPDPIIPVSADSMTVERAFSPPDWPPLSITGEEGNGQSLLQVQAGKAEESPIKIQKKKEEPPDSYRDQLPGVLTATAENEEKSNKREMFKEDLWASLSVAAGNYNSGTLSPGNNMAAASQSASFSNSSMSFGGSSVSRSPVGSSRSVGLTIGKRVARRWVILSGVNYLSQTSGYTSNSSSLGQAYLANYSSLKAASSVTYTNPYAINSVLEFLSFPVQAGYLIVDQKLGLQMNAGLSTDFLLRNTLQDPSGQVSPFSQGAGTDSPYRLINWAGLVSVELSYRLSRQYRVSMVPGIRYLFNPVFKSGSTDHPYVTDIGFRFRYILR